MLLQTQTSKQFTEDIATGGGADRCKLLSSSLSSKTQHQHDLIIKITTVYRSDTLSDKQKTKQLLQILIPQEVVFTSKFSHAINY